MKKPVYEKVEYNKDGGVYINNFGTTNSFIFESIEDALYGVYLRMSEGKKTIMEKLSDTTVRITEEHDNGERYFKIFKTQPITYRRDD